MIAALAGAGAVALTAAPFAGAAGTSSGTATASGPVHRTETVTNCTTENVGKHGNEIVFGYGAIDLRILRLTKKAPGHVNLASADGYAVIIGYASTPPVEWMAGAERSQAGKFSHVGSGRLTVNSSLTSGTLTARLVNGFKPHGPKLTVKARWSCATG